MRTYNIYDVIKDKALISILLTQKNSKNVAIISSTYSIIYTLTH